MADLKTEDSIGPYLHAEVARSVGEGALYSAGLGLVAGGMLAILAIVGKQALFEMPAAISIGGGLVSLLVAVLARRGRLRGAWLYVVMIPFVSMPTALFLVAELRYPAGAATFLTGPFLVLYAFVVVISGFVLRFRLSAIAGIVVAAQYLVVFAIARPRLLLVDTKDPLLQADLTQWSVAFSRALVYIAVGLATGGIAVVAKRLALRALAEERQKEAISRVFGQYVSDEVKDRILASPGARVGQRADAVILFSDLRGFSTFSEGRTPEEVVARLNAYFEGMVRAIHAEGGVVDKFIGDAVMASFGGVVPLSDPAGAAVRAARSMRGALRDLNARWAAEGLPPFENGIGIHAGEVVIGPIGSEDRKEFTMIGDAVNTASRIESLTKERDTPILLTEAVFARLGSEDRAGFDALGDVIVKGKQERLSIYGLERHTAKA